MIIVNPYLYFNGNCAKAFNFYKTVLNFEFIYVQGKVKPPHVPFCGRCPARQQCIGHGHPQRKGETENIQTVQD